MKQPQFTDRTIHTPLWLENARNQAKTQSHRDRRTTIVLTCILAITASAAVWTILHHLS